ncbi:MAG: peptide deformylase [Parachlamydiaceae bacterium]|nr:peptide deformylase [Parachlamydiaceae bacterium]
MGNTFSAIFTICALIVSFLDANDPLHKFEMEKIEMVDTPKYLYKILSLRLWDASQKNAHLVLSAEDEAFIHLSTKSQLNNILKKYWSNIPQFVVLKVETSKLHGKLVYETNPGGTSKYYHLYQGLIPLNSVIEAKTIYQAPPQVTAPKLDIVQVGHPALRQTAKELSVEEILSPEIQDLIQEMKITMRTAPGVGLAAPQIGRFIQLAVIEDMDMSHLSPEELVKRDRTPVPFHVIINPHIRLDDSEKVDFFEGCLSLDGFCAVVPRAKSVLVECLNERAEPTVIKAKGWYARILQHEIDHLNATLFIDRAQLQTFMSVENYYARWKGKSVAEIQASLVENPSNKCCF